MSIFNRIYSRASWGSRYRAGFGDRSGAYPLPRVWLHHSVTAQLSPNATVAQEKAQMRVLEDIGQSRFGGGISYNFCVFPSGRVYMGLGASRLGAHTGGDNTNSLSILVVGNYESASLSAAQEATIAELLRGLSSQNVLRQARLTGGHKDAPGHAWNACPGRNAYARIGAINNRAASGNVSAPKPSAPAPKPTPKPAPTPKIQWARVKKFNGKRADGIIRTGPGTKHKKVREAYANERVLLNGKRSGNWVGLGSDLWIHKDNVVNVKIGPVLMKGLNHGQFPDRPIPVNGTDTAEYKFGRVDLGQRMKESKGSTNARWARMLKKNNPYLRSVNGNVRTIKTHLKQLGHYRNADVDNKDNQPFRIACKRYLNAQRAFYTPKPPTATSWARNFKG